MLAEAPHTQITPCAPHFGALATQKHAAEYAADGSACAAILSSTGFGSLGAFSHFIVCIPGYWSCCSL